MPATCQAEKFAAIKQLHEQPGAFVIPWDAEPPAS
jgi:hypothetical protein